ATDGHRFSQILEVRVLTFSHLCFIGVNPWPKDCSQDRRCGKIDNPCVWNQPIFSRLEMSWPFNGTTEPSRISISNFSGAHVRVRPVAASPMCSATSCDQT